MTLRALPLLLSLAAAAAFPSAGDDEPMRSSLSVIILGAAVVLAIEDGQQVLDIALTLPAAASTLSLGERFLTTVVAELRAVAEREGFAPTTIDVVGGSTTRTVRILVVPPAGSDVARLSGLLSDALATDEANGQVGTFSIGQQSYCDGAYYSDPNAMPCAKTMSHHPMMSVVSVAVTCSVIAVAAIVVLAVCLRQRCLRREWTRQKRLSDAIDAPPPAYDDAVRFDPVL
ncbi:unnamed protein product (mitochondrion) [Plasmodiophora brassicae]|uniref:Uncharacterized protein n=2 Tax=Plasmodiophora brassicae TaxID=37360 RepID=A0A3P3XYV9_PLABS|nr:unnamed protein product [Plasmodiophora brassicae]